MLKMGWPAKRLTPEMMTDLNSALNKFNINTPERIRHFLAQTSHESGVGYYMVE